MRNLSRCRWTMLALMLLTLCQANGAPAVGLQPVEQVARLVSLILIVTCFSAGLVAILALYSMWRPAQVRHGSAHVRNRPLHCAIAGLLSLAILVGMIALAANIPEPVQGLLVIVTLCLAAVLLVRGGSMIAYDVGDRMLASMSSRFLGSVLASVLLGGTVILLAGYLPILGQVIQLLLFVMAAGAALTGRLGVEKSAQRGVEEQS